MHCGVYFILEWIAKSFVLDYEPQDATQSDCKIEQTFHCKDGAHE